jgi:hypothetical protein
LPSQRTLSEERAGGEDSDDGFPALMRHHRQLHPALLDVHHGGAGIPLGEDGLEGPETHARVLHVQRIEQAARIPS